MLVAPQERGGGRGGYGPLTLGLRPWELGRPRHWGLLPARQGPRGRPVAGRSVTPRGGFGSGTLGGLADLHVDAATQPFLRISLASALEHLTHGLPHGLLSSPFWLMHKPVVGPDTQDSDSPLGRWGLALWLSLQSPKDTPGHPVGSSTFRSLYRRGRRGTEGCPRADAQLVGSGEGPSHLSSLPHLPALSSHVGGVEG